MTDKEKAVVMAYTGACMLQGEKFKFFHEYIEHIMGRPVYTHELAIMADEIKEKAKADFIALCVEEDPAKGYWINPFYDNAICSCCNRLNTVYGAYCKHCGAKMVLPQEKED